MQGKGKQILWLIVLILVMILSVAGFFIGVAGIKRGISTTKITTQ